MTQKLRVLLAEGASRKAASALRESFPEEQGAIELTEVSGVSTLMASLKLVSPEVILLDLALAHPGALETVRRVHRAKPDVPLIVIGDSLQKEIAVASLREGAMDYLLKNHMNAQTLDRVLRGALERNTMKGLADLLRDPLTGLYIRDGFLTLGSRAMDTAKERSGSLVLLCAKFENLEGIRKRSGQNAAESSLREIAMLLTRSFRRSDLIARIGESQFAALAVDAIEPSAPVLLQRLRKHLEALNSIDGRWGPLQLRMTARFWAGKGARTFAEFLDEVEWGLRNAQVAGENQPQIPGPVRGR
ncbi:MAG TPA: diguanylate cyclase [Candidatus Acidoferrum sp.]